MLPFQKQLDKLLKNLQAEGRVPKLFLHSCCAPCSSYVLTYLSDFFEITVFYYNPNISPESEYQIRVVEQQRLVNELSTKHPIHFVAGEYNAKFFYDSVRGLENEPERGKRCEVCFRLRLAQTAELAKVGGFDYFCTTLSISPLKDAELLNNIGNELSEIYKVPYLPSDFKKKNGYRQSVELSKKYNLYRQNYCGCVFSKRDTEKLN